jgi:uncharacterized protein YbjT (DUF2867 family)
MSTVVVAGASGFVGRNLLPALLAAGHTVRAGSRDPERAGRSGPDGVHWVHLSTDDPESLRAALAGADALVYLVHHLVAAQHDIADHEAASARAVVEACEAAGLKRIVYLGGPVPSGPASPHLEARLRTGAVLRSGRVTCVELRAAMVIGAASESWLICRDLAFRLPVMVLPRWTATRSSPVGVDDVVAALVEAVDQPLAESVAEDLPGPEVLTGQQILERISAHAGMRPRMVGVPVLTPRLSSWWLRFVTRANYGVARQLIDGLRYDLVPREPGWWARMPNHQRLTFDEAVARALAAESALEAGGRLWEGAVRWVTRKA